VVLGIQLTMFILIGACAILTNYSDPVVGDKARLYCCLANVVLTLISVGIFELRQLVTQGLAYFNSFWNFNDLAVFCLAIAVAVVEINYNFFLSAEEAYLDVE